MSIVRYLRQINIELLVIMVMVITKQQVLSHEKDHLGLENYHICRLKSNFKLSFCVTSHYTSKKCLHVLKRRFHYCYAYGSVLCFYKVNKRERKSTTAIQLFDKVY